MEAPLPVPPDGDVITGPRYMAAMITITVIAVLIAWLRMYVRFFVSHNPGWDDYTMFAASLVAVVTNAFLINSYHYGVGRHRLYVPPENIPPAFMWLWAAEPTNLFAVYLVRLSICLFFIRLIPPKKVYMWIIWVTIAALTVSDVFTSVYYFFECRPIRKVWLPKTQGQCFGEGVQQAATWLYQATSILGDLILLTIPISLFWRLQVRLRTKIGLIIICSLGIFTNVCAIVKTVLLPALFSPDPDKTWIIKDLCLWAPMELCVGMICGTIPALAPLFGLATEKTRSRRQRYRKFEGAGSYELSSSGRHNTPGHHHPRDPSGMNSALGAPDDTAAPQKPTRSVTVTRPASKERFFAQEPDDRWIRTTYEVDISREPIESSSDTMAGARTNGENGERRAGWWNVV
ncbi:uncharacterized protein KY384_001327 [Bacidia gigantensis]|uniref:uncharacterized protein n=1 Tax=Bacidia gigantensis TaxID=2732470 RepID=UPI001D03E201|nr:uncharacterized protein KY384_001327 [Bacidia gigantensis]KAG8533587.1 hypothetical protein KY384_001327 [Bacidia gigantensis]